MKKILSLLSILKISETAVLTTIAVSSYQKEEYKMVGNNQEINENIDFVSLEINWRGVNGGNEFTGGDAIYGSFKPDLWEEIIIEKYNSNSLEDFQNKFKNKIKYYYDNNKFDEWWSIVTYHYIDKFSEGIWNNWDVIISKWRSSNKLCSIRIVVKLDATFIFVNIIDDDIHYFGNKYLNKQILNEIILDNKLGTINNNGYFDILSAVKIKNFDLDISQLEVKNKSSVSAIIKPKNNINKYVGEQKIFYKISNKEINVVDLNELIKKAIFFKFRDENLNLRFKKIEKVNSSEIIYEKKPEIDRIIDTINIPEKNICSISLELPVLEHEQIYNSPTCKILKEITTTTQVTKGIVTTEGTETNKEKSSTFSKEAHGDFELGFSTKAKVGGGFWKFLEFESEINSKTSVGGSENTSNTETTSEKIIKLKNVDNTTNETKEEKETTEIDIPSQQIKVLPNKHVKTSIVVNKSINKIILKLNQKIYGPIQTIVLLTDGSTYSFNFSIKEAMQKLEEFVILPEEIVINKNESITFNGKMSVTQSETGHDAKLIVISN